MTDSIPFSSVIEGLKIGRSFARVGWNGDHRITLQTPTEQSKMTLPYIYITTQSGDKVPWIASQTDILSEDWYEIK